MQLVSVATTGRPSVDAPPLPGSGHQSKLSLSAEPKLSADAPTLSALAAAAQANTATEELPPLPPLPPVPASGKSPALKPVPEDAAAAQHSVQFEELPTGAVGVTVVVPSTPTSQVSTDSSASTPIHAHTPTTPAPPPLSTPTAKRARSTAASGGAEEDKDFVRSDGHDSDTESYDPKSDKLAAAVQTQAVTTGAVAQPDDTLVLQPKKAEAAADAKAAAPAAPAPTTVAAVKSTAVSSGVASEPIFWPTNQPAGDSAGPEPVDVDAPDTSAVQALSAAVGLDPKFKDRFTDLNRHLDNLNPVAESKRCASCDQPIGPKEKSTYALDQYWHANHFACMGSCGQGLIGQTFMVHEGRPYCKADYLTSFGRRCNRCNDYVLEGFGLGAIAANGSQNAGPIFHPKCIQCTKCGRGPSVGGGPNAVKLFPHPESGSYYCRPCYEDQWMPRCHACAKPITDTGECGVTVRGKSYHESCAGCVVCKRPLKLLQTEGVEIYVADLNPDMMSCKRHGEDPASAHLMCPKCSEPLVSGDVGTVIGTNTTLHLACVGGCAMCGKAPIAGDPLYQRLDQFFCHNDFMELSFPSCSRCNLNIMYESPSAFNDNLYHANCLKCGRTGCTVQFNSASTNAHVRSNVLYCAAHVPGATPAPAAAGGDAKTAPRNSFNGKIPILGTGGGLLGLPPTLKPAAAAPVPAPAAPSRPAPTVAAPTPAAAAVSAEKCTACKQSLTAGSTLLIRGQKYHATCVVCKACGCEFPGGAGIIIQNDQFYCKVCFVLPSELCVVCRSVC